MAEEELKCAFWEEVRHDIAWMVSGVLTFAITHLLEDYPVSAGLGYSWRNGPVRCLGYQSSLGWLPRDGRKRSLGKSLTPIFLSTREQTSSPSNPRLPLFIVEVARILHEPLDRAVSNIV